MPRWWKRGYPSDFNFWPGKFTGAAWVLGDMCATQVIRQRIAPRILEFLRKQNQSVSERAVINSVTGKSRHIAASLTNGESYLGLFVRVET